MFLPVKQDGILEEGEGKCHQILTLGPGGGKMILILLEDVIALRVSFTLIYVYKPGLCTTKKLVQELKED